MVLIPLFLIVGTFGSRPRRIFATFSLFFYTFISSLPMLLAFIYIGYETNTFHMSVLSSYHMTLEKECILWISLFIPLAVKTPLVPFHIWLPEAHVEAPTVGSVLLAALVLKMSIFGYLRILLPLCPRASLFLSSLVFCICILGGCYAAFTACSQTDVKKIIAYSSVVHMSYATVGVFNFDSLSIISAIVAMFAHGFISAGLFFCVGFIYAHYGERDLSYYSDIRSKLPYFSCAWMFLIFSNMSFPGTMNFPAEFGIFISLFSNNALIPIFLILPLVVTGSFTIWGGTRLCYGPDKSESIVEQVEELNDIHIIIVYSCISFILLFGCDPQLITFCLKDFIKTI